LDSEGRIFFEQPNRLKRVAQGAGHTQTDVLMILDQYKQFSGMIKQMGGSNGMLANLGMTPDAMKNGMNPLQMRRAQQNMRNMVQNNPMLRNMGMGKILFIY
jgi:signal recognition particle subunit SRP54